MECGKELGDHQYCTQIAGLCHPGINILIMQVTVQGYCTCNSIVFQLKGQEMNGKELFAYAPQTAQIQEVYTC